MMGEHGIGCASISGIGPCTCGHDTYYDQQREVGSKWASAQHYQFGVYCLRDFGGGPCNDGKPIELTKEQYMTQLSRPNSVWKCPECLEEACWDDDSGETS